MVEIPTDWTAYPPDSDSGNWEIEDEYGHTATVYGEGEMAKAIAMLIAAAPELLAALNRTVSLLSYASQDGGIYGCNADEWFAMERSARAAIAKAEGRP